MMESVNILNAVFGEGMLMRYKKNQHLFGEAAVRHLVLI